MLRIGPKHGMKLYLRFGEANYSMEYSFYSAKENEKTDLFFVYSNGSNYQIPYHVPPSHYYGYLVYPSYNLCSIVLHGYKLLAPCTAETVIITGNDNNSLNS